MPDSSSVLLTGASGFVGRAVLESLLRQGIGVLGTGRSVAGLDPQSSMLVDSLSEATDWSDALANKRVVVHCAARAHIMKDEAIDPLESYRQVNTAGTLKLARQAAQFGVKRFVFISSIKVNGEQTELGRAFYPGDEPSPEDAYAISKWEAELGLRQLARETGMEVVIIRPPMVYGPGVKGNFANMVALVGRGLPLPLGAIRNKRSLIALDNLVDLVITCIDHPAAPGETFLASDGEDLSTTELLRGVANALGKPSRLVPVPAQLLQLGATLLGKKSLAQRLLGSLQVDASHTRERLNWTPPLTVKQGLERCFKPIGIDA